MYLSQVNDAGDADVLSFPLKIRPDLTFSARVTLNSRRFISNEFFYTAVYGRLQVGSGDVIATERLRIREAGYNLLVNFLRKNFVVRPYLAVGPSLTSYQYANLNVNTRAGIFQFGLRHVGAIKTAVNRAGVAPLDGGTIFRPGLNYGGGIRVRVYRQIVFRADYRETFSKDPDFFSQQSFTLNQAGTFTAQDPGVERRGVFSVGLCFGP
jgi:hypothetical protein